MMKLVPLQPDELWGCLLCSQNDRDVNAVILAKTGTPGKAGSTRTGLCGNHAEVIDEGTLIRAARRFGGEKHLRKERTNGNE